MYLMLDITFWLYKGLMDYQITFSKNMNVLYNFLIVLFGSDTVFLAIKFGLKGVMGKHKSIKGDGEI